MGSLAGRRGAVRNYSFTDGSPIHTTATTNMERRDLKETVVCHQVVMRICSLNCSTTAVHSLAVVDVSGFLGAKRTRQNILLPRW